MSRPHTRGRPALAGIAAAAVAGLAAPLFLATAAHAIDAPADYTNQVFWNTRIATAVEAGSALDLGDLTVTLKPGATWNDLRPIASVSLAPGASSAPAGYNVQGQELFLLDNAYVVASDAYQRTDAAAAGHGLDGKPLSFADSDADPIGGIYQLSDYAEWSESGYFRYIVTLSSTIDASRPHQAGVAFYDAILKWDKATGVLSVVSGDEVVKAETALTAASSAVTATSATLSATVAPAAATGTVTFTSGTISQTATLSGGVATVSVSGLSPATAYTFSATYAGDAGHLGSNGSVALTTSAVADSSGSGVTVSVPEASTSAPTGLTISVKPAPVSLSGATSRGEGEVWTAKGATGEITVNDDRRSADAGWTLNGHISPLISGANTIAASNLGWAPVKVSGSGTAGPAVIAGSSAGLTSDAPLASGAGSAEPNAKTTVSAELTLAVPATAPAGNYSGTLTLTLI
ncbi:hypothetical protein [Microbacterium sp. NPDC057944]|uniref:hypothetical protein n=1 Tax=Microbacterium sp. NPDC057944 TaxID=3346286 RepID=UPI0036D808CE